MLQSIIFSLPLLVANAVASPTWGPWKGKGQAACLSDSTVNTIIDSYTYLLENPQGADFNTTAGALLSDSFFVSSDSINTLINANGGKLPLGVNAYPSKQAFIAGQAQTPAIPQVATLGYFYSCNQIAWRWNGTGIGRNTYEVKGIITFDVNVASSQVDAVYSEFNSAAWLANIGNPECKSA
ncbi:hypothetical protein LTR70_008322 [Exophiala xenobiotica]|uniref:NTF2-like domain-containing protein n=1 Tax=Lithohypha guttulata TaxID=1690604 RepID=A0ABR0K1J1_9EURO|nr:hypothetical protein LTR24_007900 [Lithohypha guttulata]KAK5312225.1 hypothetical protein LTR70_008322 [Exophiala xenobiotica]